VTTPRPRRTRSSKAIAASLYAPLITAAATAIATVLTALAGAIARVINAIRHRNDPKEDTDVHPGPTP